ncbi:hypothetical protein EMIHUDRAFT_115968 [Emiliania huxleyi CCMP1516]|uniref:Secreted protein n=2 Tax=Emiliania huxleyi TaxID=2903 RepID=A0A0D3JLC2_EMIH1|nr:hypothetical protein EMIHUDRAFT_115968 [Emiliania huxleyi CCMP1516]EOD24307.1 hypothetical protein EMIHUDRAFT_115968 [Emiliania huxleyi CCMP1516]|eukprot:XP_005776736.1 hypothetical protein EMIHUDRAFT_115968 [Emiliania huxleyi CCMP1516]
MRCLFLLFALASTSALDWQSTHPLRQAIRLVDPARARLLQSAQHGRWPRRSKPPRRSADEVSRRSELAALVLACTCTPRLASALQIPVILAARLLSRLAGPLGLGPHTHALIALCFSRSGLARLSPAAGKLRAKASDSVRVILPGTRLHLA